MCRPPQPQRCLALTCFVLAVAVAALANAATAQELVTGEVQVVEPVWAQNDVATLPMPNVTQSSKYGAAVAMDGDTVVVGAPEAIKNGSAVSCGAAFVYDPSNQSSTLSLRRYTRLDPPSCALPMSFGAAVAVSASHIAVGAKSDASRGTNTGAVFLWSRNNATQAWEYAVKLTAADGQASDYFGWDVALQDGILVVGAPGDRSRAGSVYMYFSNTTSQDGMPWRYVRKLMPAVSSNSFSGGAVALDGGVLAVGAKQANSNNGVVVVYRSTTPRSAGTWVYAATLRPDASGVLQFGRAVAVHGNVIVVGAPNDNGNVGAAFVYESANAAQPAATTSWQRTSRLLPVAVEGTAALVYAGHSVAVRDDVIAMAAYSTDGAKVSAVCLFRRDLVASTFVLTARLSIAAAAPGQASSTLLGAVSLGSDTLLLAGVADVDNGMAALVTRTSGVSRAAVITSHPSGLSNDRYGSSVAVSSQAHTHSPPGVVEVLAVVGVPQDTVGSSSKCGSVFVYVFNTAGAQAAIHRSQQAAGVPPPSSSFPPRFTPPSVAGAPGYHAEEGVDMGAMPHDLAWSSANVTRRAQKVGSTRAPYDYFGTAVAVHGATFVVGAPGTNHYKVDSGVVYLFQPVVATAPLSTMTWSIRRLPAMAPATSAKLGGAVALSDELVAVVGAAGDLYSASVPISAGAVYVFDANSTSITSVSARILPPTAIAGLRFGSSVAIQGNTVVVGATGLKVDGVVNHGAVYVYTFDTRLARANNFNASTLFQFSAQLVPSSVSALFGHAVAVQTPFVAVGARSDGDVSTFAGAVFVFGFVRNGTAPSADSSQRAWRELCKILPSESDAGGFGASVSLHDHVLAIGTKVSSVNAQSAGSIAFAMPTNTLDVASPWKVTARLSGMAGEAQTQDFTGQSISVGATGLVAVGAPGTAPLAGKAYFVSPVGVQPILARVAPDVSLGVALQRLACVGQSHYTPWGACPAFVVEAPLAGTVDSPRSLTNAHLHGNDGGFKLVQELYMIGAPSTPMLQLQVSHLDMLDTSWVVYNIWFVPSARDASQRGEDVDGGLVRVAPTDTTATTSFTALSCVFDSGTGRRGGGLYVAGATAHIFGCYFVNCSAKAGGAAFVHQDGALRASHTTFSTNQATELRGGAVSIALASLSLDASLLTNNTAAVGGGAVHADFGAVATITSSAFVSNRARMGSGGCLRLDAVGATVADTTFRGCSAATLGGAVHVNTQTHATLSRVNASANTASRGGAVAVVQGTLDVQPGCWWMDNEASASGGALSCSGKGSLSIRDAVVSGNRAGNQGGGVDMVNCRASIAAAHFVNNVVHATGVAHLDHGGGGVFASVDSATSATAAAGATGVVSINGTSTFVDNHAVRGSAVLITTPSRQSACSTNVSACAMYTPNAAVKVGTGVSMKGTLLWLYQRPTLANSSSIVMSSMAARVVLVPPPAAPTEGLSSAAHELSVASGASVPVFRVRLQDAYGRPSPPLNVDAVAVAVSSPTASLSGPRLAYFDAAGVATVTGLVVTGVPGDTVPLSLSLVPDRGVQSLAVLLRMDLCPAGTHVGVTNTSCPRCPSGTFSPAANSDPNACRPCTGGVAPPGSDTCAPCGNGTQPGASGSQCASCDAVSVSNGTQCNACPAGQVPDALVARSRCTPCAAGSVRPGTSSVCSLCPAGTHSSADRTACVACPAGSVSTAGAASCVPCTNGTAPDGSAEACVACGLASVSNGTQCTLCPVGSVPHAVSRAACVPCPPGFVRPATSSVCSACPAGTRSDGARVVCTPCGSGQVSARGAARCTRCPNGTAPNAGAERCVPCGADAVSSGLSCTPCDAGHVPNAVSRSVCARCSPGTIRPNTSLTCTPCPSGFYANVPRTRCVECPREGVECVEGVLVLLPGYWSAVTQQSVAQDAGGGVDGLEVGPDTEFYKCPPGACEVQEDGTVECGGGRAGPLCAQCAVDHYPEADACVRCLSPTLVWVLLVSASIGSVCVTAFSIRTTSKLWQQEPVSRRAQVMPAVKIVLSYFQVMGFLSRMGIPWPESIATLWSSSESTSSVPMSSGFANCALHLGFYGLNTFTMALPLLAALVLLVVPISSACCGACRGGNSPASSNRSGGRAKSSPRRARVPSSSSPSAPSQRRHVKSSKLAAANAYKKSRMPAGTDATTAHGQGQGQGGQPSNQSQQQQQEHHAPGSDTQISTRAARALSMSSSASGSSASTATSGRSGWPMYLTCVTIVCYMLYPSVCQAAVKVLDCSPPINGVRFLQADFREVCGSPRWQAQVVFVICILVVFCIGFPASVCFLLYRHHKHGTLHAPLTRQRFLFLTQGYRDEFCWWEGVAIARKLAMAVAGAALDGAGAGHQAFAATFVLVVCLIAHMVAQPYANAAEGRLETLSLATSAFTLYIGILLAVGNVSETSQYVLLAVMLTANACFLLWAGWELMKRLRRTVRTRGKTLIERVSKRLGRHLPGGRRTGAGRGSGRGDNTHHKATGSVMLVEWGHGSSGAAGKKGGGAEVMQTNPMRATSSSAE